MMVPATTVIYGVRLSVVIQTLTSQHQNPAVKLSFLALNPESQRCQHQLGVMCKRGKS